MKLKLNIDELNEDFFDDTRLLGIIAPIKSHQFCLQLNNQLGHQFRLNPAIEIHLKKRNVATILVFTNPKNPIVF